MNSQADNLRLFVQSMRQQMYAEIQGENRKTRVITITSGKGGVGKSNYAVNLAIALSELQQKVILLDADLGLANIDVIFGINPAYNLAHVIAGEKTVSQIICEGPKGLKIIPGGNGMQELANLNEWQINSFLLKLSHLDGIADFFLIDTAAGLSKAVLSFALSADEVMVITTNEPTALTDAYGMIKTIRQHRYSGKVSLVINRVASGADATMAFNKLKIAVNRFLKCPIEYLGAIREDPRVGEAIKEQQPFILRFPSAEASRDIYSIAARLTDQETTLPSENGIRVFFSRVAHYFR